MKFNITLNKIDHDKQSIEVNGLKMPMAYFTGALLPSLLASCHPSDEHVVALVREMHTGGFNIPSVLGFEYADAAQRVIEQERAVKAEQDRFAKEAAARCHVDTPEEIAAYHAEKQKRIAETLNRVRGGRVGNGHF